MANDSNDAHGSKSAVKKGGKVFERSRGWVFGSTKDQAQRQRRKGE